MKDFPVFTTEHGVASLILKEIPYQGTAYVILRDSQEPEALAQECADFWRVCGGSRIYATGHDVLAAYPLYTAMWEMTCIRERIPTRICGKRINRILRPSCMKSCWLFDVLPKKWTFRGTILSA